MLSARETIAVKGPAYVIPKRSFWSIELWSYGWNGCIKFSVNDEAPDNAAAIETGDSMAEVKGILLNGWVKFIRDRYGDEAVNKALSELSPEDHRLVPTRFLDASWYAFDSLHALRKLTRPLVQRSDGDITVEIGRYMAQHAFTGVYKPLLAHDPIKQVQKFTSIGEFFFRGARKLETEITGPTSCLVRYRYESGAKPTRAICASLTGFWSRSIELAGAASIKASHPKCFATGSDCCEFVFEWTTASS